MRGTDGHSDSINMSKTFVLPGYDKQNGINIQQSKTNMYNINILLQLLIVNGPANILVQVLAVKSLFSFLALPCT